MLNRPVDESTDCRKELGPPPNSRVTSRQIGGSKAVSDNQTAAASDVVWVWVPRERRTSAMEEDAVVSHRHVAECQEVRS
jgi:hypothetical protein